MEKFLYNSQKALLFASISTGIISLAIHEPYKLYLTVFTFLCFFLSVFCIGLWGILGVIFRWETFNVSYKRIDFERYLGGIGSLIYIMLGFGAVVASFVCLYLLYNMVYVR
jgi:hypothetical protein